MRFNSIYHKNYEKKDFFTLPNFKLFFPSVFLFCYCSRVFLTLINRAYQALTIIFYYNITFKRHRVDSTMLRMFLNVCYDFCEKVTYRWWDSLGRARLGGSSLSIPCYQCMHIPCHPGKVQPNDLGQSTQVISSFFPNQEICSECTSSPAALERAPNERKTFLILCSVPLFY